MTKTSLFSEFLTKDKLARVNFYSYFPVLESGTGEDLTCRILPSDHGIAYPLEFSPIKNNILKGELNFYNRTLFVNYSTARELRTRDVNMNLTPNQKKALIVNTLDDCFGHTFLKILNLVPIYNEYHKNHDIIVIVPSCLAYLIPEEKIMVCVVDLSFKELTKCYNLSNVLKNIGEKYEECDYPVLSTYISYKDRAELSNFFQFRSGQEGLAKHYITFYARKDSVRRWGGRLQKRKITTFFKLLKPFFTDEVTFCVVGEKENSTFPNWIEDRRVDHYSTEDDILYNEIFGRSIIVVGMHGSSMLIPSILSDMVIHLTPNHKLHNSMEDAVNYRGALLNSFF